MTAVKRANDINWHEYKSFVDEFKNESDRAAVILGAAKLDLVMYQILQAYFVSAPGSKDELLDGDSPIGTFSAKINILHRLGLIDSMSARLLHLVRRIRNSFAHEVSGCTLLSGSHSDRVKELALPFKNIEVFNSIKKHFFEKETGPQVDFRVALAILVGRLELLLVNIVPIDGAHALSLVSPKWKEDTGEQEQPKQLPEKPENN
ncbi:MAG: hypothetical protein NDI77_09100 [Geobacteraceae bacterium]|nr:hypothetical protein [Geobacteraceae bacterium]